MKSRLSALTSKVGNLADKVNEKTKITQFAAEQLKRANHLKDRVQNISEYEKIVRECTTNEGWPAPPETLRNVAQHTFHFNENKEIFQAVWARMASQPSKHWRIIYKCLTLLEYLVLNGSIDAVDQVKANLYQVNTLSDFQFHDDKGEDLGLNVRAKAEKLISLVGSDQLAVQRDEVLGRRKRFVGIGAGSAVVNRIRSSSIQSQQTPSPVAPHGVTQPSPPQSAMTYGQATPQPPAPAPQTNLVDLFGAAPAASPAPAAPTTSHDDFFSQFSTQAATPAQPAPAQPAAQIDPFADFLGTASATPAKPAPVPAAKVDPLADLFGTAPVQQTAPVASPAVTQKPAMQVDDLFSF